MADLIRLPELITMDRETEHVTSSGDSSKVYGVIAMDESLWCGELESKS